MRTRVPLIALLVTAMLLVAGCGADETDDSTADTGATAPTTGQVSGSIVVSAAASLTDVFAEIEREFVTANPEAEVRFNFGSSGQLSTQIRDGAPADVAAFADTAPMDALVDAGLLAATPAIFARNELVIVTKPGNPEGITGLADLADVGVVALCAETAPCGTFADQALGSAGVSIPTDRITRAQDVRATLTAVTEGDAVAGIVYVTDATAVAGAAERVEIPDAHNVLASYPIATLSATSSMEVAAAFQAFVLSDPAQRLLREAGFLAP